MHTVTLKAVFTSIFLLYFALNLQSAHKMWGRKFNPNLRENLMEHINKVELKGRVGAVRSNVVNGSRVVNFSLITEIFYKTKEGSAVSDSTWFNVAAWESKEVQMLDRIEKGVVVHVLGRLRSNKFEGQDGTEKQFYELLATKLRVIGNEEANIG